MAGSSPAMTDREGGGHRKQEGRPAAALNPFAASRAYFFLPAFDTAGVIPAVARTFGFSFLGFLASLLERI